MGWLERWDRRNQRTLEWHQHLYEEEQRGPRSHQWKPMLGVAVAFALFKLLRRPLEDAVGFWWTSGMFWVIAAGCFWVAAAQQRRRRRAWEASRSQSRSAGAEEVVSGPPAAPPPSAGSQAEPP